MDNPTATGGGATIGRQNLIQNARLRPLFSHRRVALEAAASATAHWPEATSWERQAELVGRWVDGNPMRYDGQQLKRIEQKNQAATYRTEVGGLRVDHRMDSAVATKAIDVVQAMAAVSRAWPRLSPRGRAMAGKATQLAALALRHAGVEPTGPIYGEAV